MENKRLTIEIPEELHAEAKSRAYADGKTIKSKVIELLKKWLKQ